MQMPGSRKAAKGALASVTHYDDDDSNNNNNNNNLRFSLYSEQFEQPKRKMCKQYNCISWIARFKNIDRRTCKTSCVAAGCVCNFEVRRPFRLVHIINFRPGDLSFDLWPWKSRRLSAIWVFVIHLYTKLKVRRPFHSEIYMMHFRSQH